jgi:hypothetical protein
MTHQVEVRGCKVQPYKSTRKTPGMFSCLPAWRLWTPEALVSITIFKVSCPPIRPAWKVFRNQRQAQDPRNADRCQTCRRHHRVSLEHHRYLVKHGKVGIPIERLVELSFYSDRSPRVKDQAQLGTFAFYAANGESWRSSGWPSDCFLKSQVIDVPPSRHSDDAMISFLARRCHRYISVSYRDFWVGAELYFTDRKHEHEGKAPDPTQRHCGPGFNIRS